MNFNVSQQRVIPLNWKENIFLNRNEIFIIVFEPLKI